MMFNFKRVEVTNQSTLSKDAFQLYVAADMSPLDKAQPSEEFRAEIGRSSPEVQQLFALTISKSAGE
jgi:hypothetical protein